MKNIIIALVGLSFLATSAQTDTLKMSLQECVDYALKNSTSMKNSSIDEEIAKAKISEVRSIGLPQINGTAGIQHNLKLRDFFLTKNENNPFAGSLPNEANGKDFRSANLFQLPSSIDGSISFSQIIFSNSYLIGLKAAKTYAELAKRNTNQSRTQTIAAVTKSYYSSIISNERMKLFDANIARLDSTFTQTQKLNTQGFVEKIDVDRLEVTLNNLKTEREKTIQLLALSSLALKFQMGMPLETNLMPTAKISDITVSTNDIQNSKADYNNRPEYMQLTASKALQELDLKNQKSTYLPTLVFSGNVGLFTSANGLGNVITGNNFYGYTDPRSGKSFQSRWATYGLVQLGLQIPIFDGFGKSAKVQQSKLALRKTENNIAMFEKTVDLQTKSAEVNLKNSIITVEMQKKNMALAENVSNVARKKYKQGVGSNLEVTTAESALKEAQVNYYNSLFDAITSKVDYDLAVGNIK